jgi:RNA polymerase sigma factor (sigma-70 family)
LSPSERVSGESGRGAGSGDSSVDAARVQEAYERWSADIRRFLQGCLAGRCQSGAVDELLQRTFQRLLESGGDVAPGAVRSWLFRVAYNEAMYDGRRRGVERRGLERIASGHVASGRIASGRVAADGSMPTDQPWAEAVRGETVARVRSAVGQLPPEQRQVVEDRIYAGKTFAEIAAARGMPLGTVLTRMRLALGKLARSLRELDPKEHDTDAHT